MERRGLSGGIAKVTQVTKQFMSQSLGWADNIIFAMAPLGIITAVVGAIRVGGPSWLQAIIGRARENRSAAEFELTSSTSHDVCELWNGQTIVRLMGSPPILEILYFPTLGYGKECGLYTLETARAAGLMTLEKSWSILKTPAYVLCSWLTFLTKPPFILKGSYGG